MKNDYAGQTNEKTKIKERPAYRVFIEAHRSVRAVLCMGGNSLCLLWL